MFVFTPWREVGCLWPAPRTVVLARRPTSAARHPSFPRRCPVVADGGETFRGHRQVTRASKPSSYAAERDRGIGSQKPPPAVIAVAGDVKVPGISARLHGCTGTERYGGSGPRLPETLVRSSGFLPPPLEPEPPGNVTRASQDVWAQSSRRSRSTPAGFRPQEVTDSRNAEVSMRFNQPSRSGRECFCCFTSRRTPKPSSVRSATGLLPNPGDAASAKVDATAFERRGTGLRLTSFPMAVQRMSRFRTVRRREEVVVV